MFCSTLLKRQWCCQVIEVSEPPDPLDPKAENDVSGPTVLRLIYACGTVLTSQPCNLSSIKPKKVVIIETALSKGGINHDASWRKASASSHGASFSSTLCLRIEAIPWVTHGAVHMVRLLCVDGGAIKTWLMVRLARPLDIILQAMKLNRKSLVVALTGLAVHSVAGQCPDYTGFSQVSCS